MKNLIIIVIFFSICWSCSNKKNKIKSPQVQEVKTIITPSLSAIEDFDKKIELIDKPCKEIISFVADIEKINWISDTNRLKKVRIYNELNRNQIKSFSNHPYYRIPFTKSRLYHFYNSDLFKDYTDSLNIGLFKNVKSIWAYFYRVKDASNLVSDGVIEQWEFETKNQAKEALKQIDKIGDLVYFNTSPYFCQMRNYLIIFQTRAMAFSYDQKLLFEKFLKEKMNQ